MSIASQGQGSQAATVGTEHTLLDVAVAGTFLLYVDLFNMAQGDTVMLRVYVMVLTGGTRRVAYHQDFVGVQQDVNGQGVVAISVPISNELTDAGAIRFTLQQTTGTGHSYPWKVVHA